MSPFTLSQLSTVSIIDQANCILPLSEAMELYDVIHFDESKEIKKDADQL
jgi:hypothetical protein